MSYYLLTTEDGRAITLPAPGTLQLLLAPTNPLDKFQHFRLDAAAEGGSFVVGRTTNHVFDVRGNVMAEGTPVITYNKNSPVTANQRFTYTSPGYIISESDQKYSLTADSANKVIISAKGTIFIAVPIPNEYNITTVNNRKTYITLTYSNAPASEATTSWTVAPGATATTTFPQGAVLVAKDASGNVLAPTPYTVSKVDTLTFEEPNPNNNIKINNNRSSSITITSGNQTWTIPAGGSTSITIPQGSIIVAKDTDGNVLAPTPYTVTKDDTISFSDPTACIILYDDLNATGNNITYNGPEPNLTNSGWNEKTKSFKVISGTWIIYQDYMYGNKIVANPRGGTNLDGIYNNGVWGGYPATVVGISSLRPLPFSGLSLFNYYNFENTTQVNVNSDVADLTTLNFANLSNSLVVVSGVWELWDRIGWQGACRLVTVDGGRDGTGWYNLPQQWGGRANSTLSIRRRI